MPNRILTDTEREQKFKPLLQSVLTNLSRSANDDRELEWTLRRKLCKELNYIERSKPNKRKRLKKNKLKAQDKKCAECEEVLPDRGNVLDRGNAMAGYTPNNTRLICQKCDQSIQTERQFK